MSIRTRKLIGAVLLILLVTVWSLLAMAFAQFAFSSPNAIAAWIFYVVAGLGWVRTQFGHFDQLRRQAEWLLARNPDEHPELWAHAVAAQSVAAVWLARFDLLDLLDDAVEALSEDAHRARRLAHYLGAWAAAVQRADVDRARDDP